MQGAALQNKIEAEKKLMTLVKEGRLGFQLGERFSELPPKYSELGRQYRDAVVKLIEEEIAADQLKFKNL